MSLNSLGWSAFFESENIDFAKLYRITAIHRSHLEAIGVQGSVNLYLPGGQSVDVTVGDWVQTTPEFIDEQNKRAALIQKVLSRKSKISRMSKGEEQVFAANIDNVFIVTSCNLDFKVNRLQRFILLVKEGHAQPIVLLSKADLSENVDDTIKLVSKQLEVKVIATSALNKQGLNQVLELMPEGSTSVFVGSSGVGKSTLVNELLGENLQDTKDIREDDHKGRHTTTARQMFFIPGHGIVVDTPGVREVQVFGSDESLQSTFPHIEELIQQCKFSDCRHETEPGCAIRSALESDTLSRREWESYNKLLREMAFSNRKLNKAEAANAKKRWRDINVAMRKKRKIEEGQ